MSLVDFKLDDVRGLITGIREAITGEKIVDPEKLKELDIKLKNLDQQLNLGQMEINKIEAASSSLFVAGWRPAIGWSAAIALFLMYVPKAFVITVIWVYKCYIVLNANPMADIPVFPDLGAMDIIGLVISMLGMAGIRTYEKKTGVARNIIKKG